MKSSKVPAQKKVLKKTASSALQSAAPRKTPSKATAKSAVPNIANVKKPAVVKAANVKKTMSKPVVMETEKISRPVPKSVPSAKKGDSKVKLAKSENRSAIQPAGKKSAAMSVPSAKKPAAKPVSVKKAAVKKPVKSEKKVAVKKPVAVKASVKAVPEKKKKPAPVVSAPSAEPKKAVGAAKKTVKKTVAIPVASKKNPASGKTVKTASVKAVPAKTAGMGKKASSKPSSASASGKASVPAKSSAPEKKKSLQKAVPEKKPAAKKSAAGEKTPAAPERVKKKKTGKTRLSAEKNAVGTVPEKPEKKSVSASGKKAAVKSAPAEEKPVSRASSAEKASKKTAKEPEKQKKDRKAESRKSVSKLLEKVGKIRPAADEDVQEPAEENVESGEENLDDEEKKNGLTGKPGASKNDTMKTYMNEIGQISLVSKEQEVDLAAKIHGIDNSEHDEARKTLIKANLRLVVKIAHDFKGLGLPLLDPISEGNIGLMRAVEKFDPAKGAKFSSYAAWWIKQSMRRALANQSRIIRIPVQSAGKINKIKSIRTKLAEKLGREPTDAEIAKDLDFSERTVAGLRLADLRTFSLHDPIQQGEDGEFQDIIPDRGAQTPDRILSDVESVSRLVDLLSELDERERMILKMRFGLDGNRPKTLEEVSQTIGRTRERVRQIQNQALTRLRELLQDEAGYANNE